MKGILLTVLTVFLISHCVLIGQPTVSVQKDTVFANYNGLLKFQYQRGDTLKNKTGRIEFIGRPNLKINDDTLHFSNLNFSGNYLQGNMNGLWQIKFGQFEADEITITTGPQTRLNHRVNGIEKQYNFRYSKGRFNGMTTTSITPIKNGRSFKPKQEMQLNFDADTLKGAFIFDGDALFFKGQTNALGFLIGTIEFKYPANGLKVIETRRYDDGFLLSLVKRNQESGDTIVHVEYDAVRKQLSAIKNIPDSINYKLSDKYFGVRFNLGYPIDDQKLTTQSAGNKILLESIEHIDSIHKIYCPDSSTKPILKFTRRFQFVYPAEEDNMLVALIEQLDTVQTPISTLLDKPALKMRKNQSDSLNFYYQILKHALEKTRIIEDLTKKIQDGFFDFRFRDAFLADGISGLNQIDSIQYNYKGTHKTIPWLVEQTISKPDDLFIQLQKYLEAIYGVQDSVSQIIGKQLRTYENQEVIDSLDRAISKIENQLTDLYSKKSIYEKQTQDKIPFEYKMFFSINERLIESARTNYLNKNNTQNEAINYGQELLCLLTFLESNKADFEKIGQLERFWNDSLFTRYQENPFDYRKLETKILEGVYQGVTILLKSYGTNLLNARSCSQMQKEISQIEALDKRTLYIVENSNTENVQKLNRTLRRERVPNRIERMLEL
jgi:hypothetical protein